MVNVGSTAGIATDPYEWPEYAVAKAGLVRASTALAEIDGVRVNCVVPDWLATDRALAELPELPGTEPPPIPLSDLRDAVVDLVRDEDAAGKVVVLRR